MFETMFEKLTLKTRFLFNMFFYIYFILLGNPMNKKINVSYLFKLWLKYLAIFDLKFGLYMKNDTWNRVLRSGVGKFASNMIKTDFNLICS